MYILLLVTDSSTYLSASALFYFSLPLFFFALIFSLESLFWIQVPLLKVVYKTGNNRQAFRELGPGAQNLGVTFYEDEYVLNLSGSPIIIFK